MRTFVIPSEIQVAGAMYTVEQPEYIPDDYLGYISYPEGVIKIAHSYNKEGNRPKMIERQREVTFYHEITHAILHTMGKYKLNNDESFVDAFAYLLSQVMHQVVDAQLEATESTNK